MDLVVPAFVRNDVQEAVEVLERRAVEAWMREDENIDDITIIVIFFKYYWSAEKDAAEYINFN